MKLLIFNILGIECAQFLLEQRQEAAQILRTAQPAASALERNSLPPNSCIDTAPQSPIANRQSPIANRQSELE